jgi:hypothetical protein
MFSSPVVCLFFLTLYLLFALGCTACTDCFAGSTAMFSSPVGPLQLHLSLLASPITEPSVVGPWAGWSHLWLCRLTSSIAESRHRSNHSKSMWFLQDCGQMTQHKIWESQNK